MGENLEVSTDWDTDEGELVLGFRIGSTVIDLPPGEVKGVYRHLEYMLLKLEAVRPWRQRVDWRLIDAR